LSLSIKLYGESNSPNQKVVKFLKSLEKHYYFAKGIWEDFNVVRGKKEAYNCTEAFSTPKVDRDALTARKSDNIVEMERNIDAISCLEILSLYPDTPIQEYKGSQYLSEKRILSSIWAVASADIKKLKDLQKN